MIATDFNFSDPLNWLLLVLVTVLLLAQMWIIVRNHALAGSKKIVRIGLNLVLWLAVFTFVLQPYREMRSSPKLVIIAGNDVPTVVTEHVRDSIGVKQVLGQDDAGKSRYDTIILLGQDFNQDFFSKIDPGIQSVKWIPFYKPGQLQSIDWSGILRKGQVQHVRGALSSSGSQLLKIRYAGNTLDSMMLKKGLNCFDLHFPVFALGRIAATLELDTQILDTVRFFARPPGHKTYQFVLESPDFESRTLAGWLGENGNPVSISTVLSNKIQSKNIINKAVNPDIFITDPANSTHPVIKKALAAGKSVLMIGLNQAERDFVLMNQAFGSKFDLARISQEQSVTVFDGLTALPFRFINSGRTYQVPDLPVAITKTNAKIGVSLLNETYPLMLSGDSLAYDRIWTAILARIAPADTANIEIRSPIVPGTAHFFEFNNMPSHTGIIPVEMVSGDKKMLTDTLFAHYSVIGKKTAGTLFLPGNVSGWSSLGEPFQDAEFFTEGGGSFKEIAKIRAMSNLVNAGYFEERNLPALSSNQAASVQQPIPDVAWLLIFLVIFTALWAEPKLFS